MIAWQTKCLSDVCVLDKKQGNYSGLPYVGLEHIESMTGRFIGDFSATDVKSSTFKFSNEHVLYGRLRPYLNKVLLPSFETGHCSTEIMPLKVNNEILAKYLFYWLTSSEVVEKINETCTGARMPRANMKEVMSFEIPLPPIPEQQRIVAILDQAFADIEKARANAEKNLKNARELFDSYLNQVFSQRGEGWVERPLGELFDVRDGTHDSPSYQESGFPLVTSKNLINGQISLEKVKYISASDFEKINKRSKVDIGDVLLAMIGTIGNPVVVTQEPSYAIKNVALIKGMPSQNSSFLKYFLESPFTVTKMLAEAKGTTQKFVGLGYLRDFPFYAPSIAEQKSIVDSLDKLSEKVQQLEKRYQEKLNSLDELKKSLLQKAFSGELTQSKGIAV